MSNLTQEGIQNKILELGCEYDDKITFESNIMLSLDSLDIVEFTMNVEKEYNIAITDSELESIKNLQDVVSLVVEKISKRI